MSRPTPTVHRVPWADRYVEAYRLMGGDGIAPARHPKDADAFVAAVTIRGAGPIREVGGFLAYETAVIIAEYAVPEYAN